MPHIAFIGDEITAAGFRLAGAHVATPPAADVPATLARVRDDSDLIILTAEYARYVPAQTLETLGREGRPALLIVADAPGRQWPPDFSRRIRLVLGIAG